jgi:hypothetical protein
MGPLLVVGGAAVLSTVLYASVGALVGDTAARHVGLPGLVISALLYDLLLAPFAVPAVMLLARRFGGDGLGGEVTGPGLGTVARYRTTRKASSVGPIRRKKLGVKS